MWVPASEAALAAALQEGLLRESPAFDAKVALPRPGKNKDLAKDICAMTVDGGMLLYGLGGDDPTRPDQLCPFDLSGAAERIDQVAQTGIAEAPEIEIRDVPSDQQPGRGYLAVVIPPSPRAPHMLTLDGDNRYWGRGQTGNRILTEGEVARLYERRERWETDRVALLDRAVEDFPFSFEGPPERLGPMLVVTRPVATQSSLVAKAAAAEGVRVEQVISGHIAQVARQIDPYPGQGTSGLEALQRVVPRGAGRWFVMSGDDLTRPYQALLDARADGELRYWHSPVINSNVRHGEEQLLVMEQSVTRAVVQALAAARWLYERAGYGGPIDLGVAVLHIEAAFGASLTGGLWFDARPFGAPDYRHHDRFLAEELQDLQAVTRRLLDALFAVLSVNGYDPFEASQRRP